MPSITSRYDNLHRVGPQVPVAIGVSGRYIEALKIRLDHAPAPVEGMALVDTGATFTVIQRGVAAKLGLSPIGQETISTASARAVACHKYDVDLFFPQHNSRFGDVVVVEVPIILEPIICLIGRDVLSQAVFVYIGHDNSFTLSF
jgi:predicted aspartyl protease